MEARITLAAFLARPETDPPEEFRGGTIVPKPSLAPAERWLRSDVATLLFGWARASQQGAVAAGARCALGGGVYVPDAAYSLPERVTAGAAGAGGTLAAPDLAVDVCPAAVDPAWFAERAAEYLAGGVRQVWVLDAGAESVAVFAGAAEPRTIPRGGLLEAPDLLPGFYVHLDDLFEALAEAPVDSA